MSIEECEFSDEVTRADIEFQSEDIVMLVNRSDKFTTLNKQDVTALAKHFKLTEEDLK